jgi:hypothetical protein
MAACVCVRALCKAGLPVKRAEALRREFIHAYGARHVATLAHLQARGVVLSVCCAQRVHAMHSPD